MPSIDHVKADDLITVGLLNRIVDQIEQFANLRSGSPYIILDDGPHGKLIELDLPVQTWALLSGSTSPYSFTEVRDAPGGTWVSMPNGDSGTTNCYEINGKSGLSGKVVPITWTAAGDWRFQYVGVGSPCSGHGNTLCFHLVGCPGAEVQGASVEFKLGGVTVFSGSTDSSGSICYFEPAPGTYSIVWSYPSSPFSGSTSATVFSSCANVSVEAFVNLPSGYACRSCCGLPTPVLYITDAAGTRLLTDCVAFGGGSMRVSFGVATCTSPPTYAINISFYYGGCAGLVPCDLANPTTTGHDTGLSVPLTACWPFYLEGTYPASGNCGGDVLPLPITGTFAIHT